MDIHALEPRFGYRAYDVNVLESCQEVFLQPPDPLFIGGTVRCLLAESRDSRVVDNRLVFRAHLSLLAAKGLGCISTGEMLHELRLPDTNFIRSPS